MTEFSEIDPVTYLTRELEQLWCDEYCSLEIAFEDGFNGDSPWPWVLSLSWATEHDTPHGASWAEYHWQFYGPTFVEALDAAVEWAKELVAFATPDEDESCITSVGTDPGEEHAE